MDSEAELWSRSRTGDGHAFGALFDRHHARVLGHALRLVTDRTEAEDVTATTFLELWRRRDAVRIVDGSVLPWLLVTTSNVSRNSQRGTRRYRRLLSTLPREEPVTDGADLALEAAGLHDSALTLALRALPARDLHLVTLVALEDLTITGAAEVLGLTPAAAKSRLHRARARLRAALADHPDSVRPVSAGGAP